MLDDLIQSWFGRHRSTEAMQIGSANEIPTIERLVTLEWIHNFYECGLLEWREAPYVTVSPDGVVMFSLPGRPDDKHLACVEIKPRSSPTTIAKAEEAVSEHGSIVYCAYNDAVFKSCVPYENRIQVLHQALVTGLEYGMFVVSKVEENVGSLVQIVVIQIDRLAKRVHGQQLLKIGSDLIGWMVTPGNVASCKISATDFPPWVSDEQAKIINSQYRLWSVQYKIIVGTEASYQPTSRYQPTSIRYNMRTTKESGAWTKIRNRHSVFLLAQSCPLRVSSQLCFSHYSFRISHHSLKGKYLFRCIDGVTFNHWRCEQARTVVKPILPAILQSNKNCQPLFKYERKPVNSVWMITYSTLQSRT